jgi:hypothetical protein
MKGKYTMKTQNIVFISIAFALAVALAPLSKGDINPQGGPSSNNEPAISIHSTGNVARGKTGTLVLVATPAVSASGASVSFVNFKVSGTAVPGVDYVALVSPAFIGQSGFGVLLIKTLPDRRAIISRQAYSVVVTLEPGAGYALGESRSAQLLIEPEFQSPTDR